MTARFLRIGTEGKEAEIGAPAAGRVISGDPHFATWNAYDYFNARIPAYNYLDLEATWNVSHWLQLRAGANNILDKDPPIVDSFIVAGGAANTYSTYDMFGRQLFAAFTAKF